MIVFLLEVIYSIIRNILLKTNILMIKNTIGIHNTGILYNFEQVVICSHIRIIILRFIKLCEI